MGLRVVRKPNENTIMMMKRLKRLMNNLGIFSEMLNRSSFVQPSEKRRKKEKRRRYNATLGRPTKG